MRPRYVVRISPADVGQRVTIRARHHGPEASATDTVGVLRRWSDGVLEVERRDGELRRVPESDLLAARVIPPAPDDVPDPPDADPAGGTTSQP